MSGAGWLSQLPRLAAALLDALEEAGLKAALGGGLAYNLWGAPRATKDIDLNVFVDEGRYAELLRVLESFGCGPERGGAPWDEQRRAEFLRCAREGEVAIAWVDEVRIDVFVPSIPFYVEAERTLVEAAFCEDQRVRRVLSPETLAVFKLLFFREKDVVDLRRLVALNRESLDCAWVRSEVVGMLGEDAERVSTWDEIVSLHGPGSGSGGETRS